MVWKIHPRYGVEVSVRDHCDIHIKQERSLGEEAVVILSSQEAMELIPLLQAAIKKSELWQETAAEQAAEGE